MPTYFIRASLGELGLIQNINAASLEEAEKIAIDLATEAFGSNSDNIKYEIKEVG